MRKHFAFFFLVTPLCIWGQNVVFNPGFDMTPWDTGWTIQIDTSSQDGGACDGVAIGVAKLGTGRSFPNCCSLYAETGIYCSNWGSGGGNANVMVSQAFNGISNCMINLYIKYWVRQFSSPSIAQTRATIQVCVNLTWETIWKKEYYEIDTIWSEVDTTIVSGTVSGIRFCAFSWLYRSSYSSSDEAYCNFWIDDIYVGEAGIEEQSSIVKNLAIQPNPFFAYTKLGEENLGINVKIYDMGGNLVEETKGNIIGEKLPPGVYFVKIKDYKPVKIVKIGGVK